MITISPEARDALPDREKVGFILEDGIVVGFMPYLERMPRSWSGELAQKHRPRLFWEGQ